MATLSGKDGKVFRDAEAIADVTLWKFRSAAKNRAYASSATGGFKRTLPGVKQAGGRFAFLLNTASPQTDQLAAGDAVTLLLQITTDQTFSVPAVIDSVEVDVNIDTAEVVGGVAEFSAAGAWSLPEFDT
jgi:hypothetical protein